MFRTFPGAPGVQAAENALATQWNANVDTLVTGMVRGTPQDPDFPGNRILPNQRADSINFRWRKYGLEHMTKHDTGRALRAATHESEAGVTYETGTVERDSWKVPCDVAEMAEAGRSTPAYQLRRENALLAQEVVRLSIEYKKAQLLTTAGNYAATLDASTGGNQWDAGGDPQDQIWNAISAMGAVQPNNLSLWISRKALIAFFKNNVWKASRAGTEAAGRGGVQIPAMSEWLGVNVWSSDPRVANTAGGTDSMYEGLLGDKGVGILYLDRPVALDKRRGDFVPGKTWTWDDGVQAQSWYDPDRTSWYESWNEWTKPQIIDNTKLYLLYNLSS